MIKILNPPPQGASFLSEKHARRYVKQGRAQWAGSHAIRFVESDHRHQSVLRQSWRTSTAPGYDARGLMTLAELKRLPTVGDEVKLIVRRQQLA